MKTFTSVSSKRVSVLATSLLLAVIANGIHSNQVNANPEIVIDENGAVSIDANAFDMSTGPMENGSNIPLPLQPIHNPTEGVAQDVHATRLAPNSMNLTVDTDSINQQFQTQAPGFDLQEDSLQMRTTFTVTQRVGQHAFGEGIEVNVYGPDGALNSSQQAFVSGDAVKTFNGQSLASSGEITVNYGPQDRVELRVLNLRPGANGTTTLHESAIYSTAQGQWAVEDSQRGGDLDFNDGDYLRLVGGSGEATVVRELQTTAMEVSYNTEVIETEIDPLMRQEQFTQVNRIEFDQQFEQVEEERQWGSVDNSELDANVLPHATGATTTEGEQLVFNRYAAATQLRLDSEGAALTGQLPPLVNDPAVPPTLLSGTVSLDPGAGSNQAGLSVTVGMTQFLHSTHQDARDMYGQVITNPNPEGPRLVQPTGLVHNTRLVGYVPATPDQVIPGELLSSVQGVFELPSDKAVLIEAPNPQQVGRGDAAYTDNVGGFIIEWRDGSRQFIPQWTQAGFAAEAMTLEAGAAQRVMYALVPQQAGQALQLGQAYAVVPDAEAGYRLADGGFQVIAADTHAGNFHQELAEVYAVEDTLQAGNLATDQFNGIRGTYRQPASGTLVDTVDHTLAASVDARVGNVLATPETMIPGDPGQQGYYETTMAGGLYLRGGLSIGLGNQQDLVRTTTSTYDASFGADAIETITSTFMTPRTQVDTYTTELFNTITETTREDGTARFNIDPAGQLFDVEVSLNPAQLVSRQVEMTTGETVMTRTIHHGEEVRVSTTSTVSSLQTDAVSQDATLIDRQVVTTTDSYPNVSPVQGELALGSILNFGNTPWTAAANIARAELFSRDVVMGQSQGGAEFGWRAEVVVNPFGEVQRPAHTYDAQGNLVPLYETLPRLDNNGQPVFTTVETVEGEVIQVAANQFRYDEAGQRLPATVGTGRSTGPSLFLRVEDVFGDQESVSVAGGLKFAL
jgi:hypothetical protein